MKRRLTKWMTTAILALVSLGALLVLPASPANAATEVCAGRENVPRGFVKINDHWDPTSCGKPPRITYNVWIIESTSDKPVGTLMAVCAGWRPAGWVTVDTDWDPTRCGHPAQIYNNIWYISRRV